MINITFVKKLMVVLAAAVCFFGITACADIAIDADGNYASAWYAYMYPDYWNAQSFTPTTPYLYAIESYHYPNMDETGEYTVEIWAHDAAAAALDPNQCRVGSAPLASSTITRMVTGSQPDCWVRWNFDPPVDVSSYVGQEESLLIYWTTPGFGPAPSMSDLGDVPGYGYLGGVRYYVRGAGAEWHRELIWDMTFRTYGSEDPCELTNIVCDVRQEQATGWFPYQPDYYNAQAFDPNRPYLYAVEGYFNPGTSLDGEFTVEIWKHNGGTDGYTDPRVGDAPLGTATITHIETGAQPNCWVRWDFSPAIDVSEYYYSGYAQPLMILWKTPNTGPSTTYSNLDPYADGVRYWITNTAGEESLWSWTRYNSDDMMFRTYGSYGAPWVCGGAGSVYLPGDVSGPDGTPDCYINMYDLAVIANDWLKCTDPVQSRCDEFWRE